MLAHRQSLVALTIGILLLVFGSAVPAAQVNINTADAATLARELKGIGLKRAQDIVDYRQKHGPFRSADELALVKGIGPAAIAKNREFIRTDGKGASAAAKPAAGAGKPAASTAKPVTDRSR
jgi:competence protein ComEA